MDNGRNKLKKFCNNFELGNLPETISNATVAWARSFGIGCSESLQGLIKAQVGLFGAALCPAAGHDVMQLASDFFGWLILFDDKHGEDATPKGVELLRDFATDLEAASVCNDIAIPSPQNYFNAVMDLVQRGNQIAHSKAWKNRFIGNIKNYVLACVVESRFRLVGIVPTMESYLSFRDCTIAMRPLFDIMSLCLPAETKQSLPKLEEQAVKLCAWANDICSAEREFVNNDKLNAVAILAEELSIPGNVAIDVAINLYRENLIKFIYNVNYVGTEDLAYAKLLLSCVNGNMYWYVTSKRYDMGA